jgi:hypothetical protein
MIPILIWFLLFTSVSPDQTKPLECLHPQPGCTICWTHDGSRITFDGPAECWHEICINYCDTYHNKVEKTNKGIIK